MTNLPCNSLTGDALHLQRMCPRGASWREQDEPGVSRMLSASQGTSACYAGDQDLHALAASLVYSCTAQGMKRTSVLRVQGVHDAALVSASAGTASTHDSRLVAELQLAGGCRLLSLL